MTTIKVKFNPTSKGNQEGSTNHKITRNGKIRQSTQKSKSFENDCSLRNFMGNVIQQLKDTSKERTSETYTAALNSFMTFRGERDVPLDGLDSNLLISYEAWLKARGVTKNTISFYMRILRAVYNRAVEKGLTEQHRPFRHVYTGVDKTAKRAVSIDIIKKLKSLDLSDKPARCFARDMFLFSFYTRGMSFVDMAFLKKNDLKNGILTYRRRKTGQKLTIKWEKCMEEIVKAHPSDDASPYLLPIIKKKGNERKQHRSSLHLMNYHLKNISQSIGLQQSLTMYVARHSWASAAQANNIPICIISEGMGHNSEATTRIYLASIETSIVDNANKMLLDLL